MTGTNSLFESEKKEKAAFIRTQRYLEKEYIGEDDLNGNGLYTPKYIERAEPIVVNYSDKSATMELIRAGDKKEGLGSFPTLLHFEIDDEALKSVTGVSRLSSINPNKILEPTGLAAIPVVERSEIISAMDATRQVYSQGLRYSIENDYDLWVMNVDPKMITFLERTLGEGSCVPIGGQQAYKGPPTIPVALRPFAVVESVLGREIEDSLSERQNNTIQKNKEDIKLALQGVSERYLSDSLLSLLHENDIETTKELRATRALEQLWRHKKTAFYGSIIGYSVLRFAGVGNIEEFDGNLPLFAGIDVATAATQVVSMEIFFTHKNRAIRALGAIGAIGSFVAPYAYFYANGDDYPWFVNIVAGSAAAIGAGLEIDKTTRDKRVKSLLADTDLKALYTPTL